MIKLISRYLFSKHNKNRSRSIKIVISLILSTIVILLCSSIMDFLQISQLDNIKKVKSFPLVLYTDEENYDYIINKYSQDADIFKYKESKGVLLNEGNNYAVNIRYIDSSYLGEVYFTDEFTSLAIAPSLYRKSNNFVLTTLEKGNHARFVPQNKEYKLSSLFYTPLGSSFDQSMVFLPFEYGSDNSDFIIAFTNIVNNDLEKMLKEENFGKVFSFRESESSLYNALVLEKIVMTCLLFTLFIIILVQSIQNAKFLSLDKQKEIVSLYLLGYSKKKIYIFSSLIGFFLSGISIILGGILTHSIAKLLLDPFLATQLRFSFSLFLLILIIVTFFSSLIYLVCFKNQLKEIKKVVSL